MTIERLGLAALAFVVGGILGGFGHQELLYGVALAALERNGADPVYFNVKPVGETFGFLTYFYGLGILAILVGFVCFTIAMVVVAIDRWRHGPLIWPSRPSFAALLNLIAGASLGTLCAAIVNFWMVNGEYAAQLAIEERFAVASASAVPEIRALTNLYAGIAFALCIGAVMIQALQMRHRRA
jgi:hypothetical protein